MTTRWMITNRAVRGGVPGSRRGDRSYWMSSSDRRLDRLSDWTEVTARVFQRELLAAAQALPRVNDPLHQHEDQKHVCLFVHGYNNSWIDAVLRYDQVSRDLFDGERGLGLSVLFSWPSDGMLAGYVPDRVDADHSADDVAQVLVDLHDYQVAMQRLAMKDPSAACQVKISAIAHSMGNYVMQQGVARAWTRANRPALVSLFSQLLMVAADVDNDLFACGESSDGSPGEAIANLCYRVTALYSGRDPALAASAGLKHFGKRRLGRSGLDRAHAPPDNVWDYDCTPLLGNADTAAVHSAYFTEIATQRLMVDVLRGLDRAVVVGRVNSRG